MRRLMSAACCLWIALAMPCGCAGTLRAGEGPPSDFSCEVTVLPGGRLGAGWYIVDADGVLRAALGARGVRSPAPPPARILSDDELAEVWRLARPLADKEPNGSGTVDIYVAGSGGARRVRVTEDEGAGLAEALARLAWGK